MTGAVRMALEAACREDAFYGPGKSLPGYDAELRAEYAQIIAAFLRALPDYSVMQGLKQPPPPGGTLAHSSLHFIAAAVEAAAVTRAASEDRG